MSSSVRCSIVCNWPPRLSSTSLSTGLPFSREIELFPASSDVSRSLMKGRELQLQIKKVAAIIERIVVLFFKLSSVRSILDSRPGQSNFQLKLYVIACIYVSISLRAFRWQCCTIPWILRFLSSNYRQINTVIELIGHTYPFLEPSLLSFFTIPARRGTLAVTGAIKWRVV